jgi:hypothetical protein
LIGQYTCERLCIIIREICHCPFREEALCDALGLIKWSEVDVPGVQSDFVRNRNHVFLRAFDVLNEALAVKYQDARDFVCLVKNAGEFGDLGNATNIGVGAISL